jgi:flavin-dependent dehydrogenase
MYDAIVIGARCAGAPTAMLLARRGHRVLLVDRARFPSDIPHGHFLHRHGPRRLQRWGLLDRVAARAPAITTMTVDMGDFPLTGRDLVLDGVALGYGPRRSAFDKILVDAAVEAGAELREEFTVDDVVVTDGRVAGIRGRARGSDTTIVERATVVVGADGRNSRLARLVQAPAVESTPPVTCWYWSYYSGVPDEGLELYVRGRRLILVFPTGDGLVGVFAAWSADQLDAVRADVDGALAAVLDEVPSLAARVRSGRREERFYGATDVPNFIRRAVGPGWALVGDAGCHKDPFLALGMCDALRDADLLAEALHEGFTGSTPLAEAMAGYARSRDEATRADYEENLELARFRPPPPQQVQLRAALRDDPEATRRFYLAYQGMVPRESFFNPANLQRIVAARAG